MKTKEEARAIVNGLKALYPDGICSLQYQKDYELLFSVRLSAQCTDARVNKVTPALFQRFPTLEAFAEATPEEVAEYIHSCGFYNGKSRDLVGCAQMLLRDFGGKVPRAMDDSVKTPRHRPQDRQPHSGRHLPRTRLRGSRHPLHPHLRPSGSDRRDKRPDKGGKAAAGSAAAGGIQRLLPPIGAPRTGGVYRSDGQV